MTRPFATGLPGGHSEWEPPDPFSNSEVKTLCADASVDFVDVKVGHCQALNLMENENPRWRKLAGVFSVHYACKMPRITKLGTSPSPKRSSCRSQLWTNLFRSRTESPASSWCRDREIGHRGLLALSSRARPVWPPGLDDQPLEGRLRYMSIGILGGDDCGGLLQRRQRLVVLTVEERQAAGLIEQSSLPVFLDLSGVQLLHGQPVQQLLHVGGAVPGAPAADEV